MDMRSIFFVKHPRAEGEIIVPKYCTDIVQNWLWAKAQNLGMVKRFPHVPQKRWWYLTYTQ